MPSVDNQQVEETLVDADDRTKDIDVSNISEDVDTTEVLRSGNAAVANFQNADLVGYQAGLRAQHLADLVQASRFRDAQHAQTIRQDHELSNQNQRHNDHTLIDLHGRASGNGGS